MLSPVTRLVVLGAAPARRAVPCPSLLVERARPGVHAPEADVTAPEPPPGPCDRCGHRACVFCEIVRGEAPANMVAEWPEAVAFVPLNPVTPGHVLIVPREHVQDFTSSARVSAQVMACAAIYAEAIGACNLITSRGAAATQSVLHLHLHVVPRRENDGLALPWYSGKRSRS